MAAYRTSESERRHATVNIRSRIVFYYDPRRQGRRRTWVIFFTQPNLTHQLNPTYLLRTLRRRGVLRQPFLHG